MRRLSLCIAIAAAALVVAPSALADGPLGVIQGGSGVSSHARPNLHYVAIADRYGTLLETINVRTGAVWSWNRVSGAWGVPAVGIDQSGEGLSRDGRTLVLADPTRLYASPSKFLVVDARPLQVIRTISLDGSFSFDALSPDASRLYLIQYASANDQSHYIVRAYDMQTNRLLPGKIADRSEEEEEESMAGTAITRATSASGRWVYTLYQKPSGEPFVHALDTKRAVAHCIDLPANPRAYNIALSLRDGGRTLAADWRRTGRPWLSVDVGSSWQISYPSGGRFPWAWLAAGIVGGIAVLSAGGLLLWRRRGEDAKEQTRQELGLA